MDFDTLRKQLQDRVDTKEQGDNSYLDKYWQLSEEETVLRLLPLKDPEDERPFYAETKLHRVPRMDGTTSNYHCRYFHEKETCPICELYFNLWKIKTTESIALARKIKPRTRVYFNAYSRETGEVKILSVGIKLFDKVVAAIIDSDYGDVTSVDAGHDLKIIKKFEKSGNETFPNYDNSSFRPMKSVLAEKKGEIKEILGNTHDLFDLITVKSYDELKAVVDNLMGADNSSESSTDETPAENTETKQEVSKELTDDEFIEQLGG